MQIQNLKVSLLLLFGFTLTGYGQGTRYFRVVGPVQTTITQFTADGHVTWTNSPTNVTFTVQTAASLQSPVNWMDYIQVPATNPVTTHWLFDLNPPVGMTLIPAGSFQMGDALNDGWAPDGPVHTNFVSAIYMDTHEINKALWDDVFQWATNHGYSFDNPGSWEGGTDYSKGPDHPVSYISWYDAVKWCNARSEKELRVPAYYTDALQTNPYRSGQADLQSDWVNWAAGYRLPTEAEWEKAARGGVTGRRFSWADANTITHAWANYLANSNYVYDLSPSQGLHPDFDEGTVPFTAPVGTFASNGYGIFDSIGNVSEWCWDKYSSTWYSEGMATQDDTRGPAGSLGDNASRLYRGGAYASDAFNSRVAYRRAAARTAPAMDRGFRSVLPIGP